MKAISAPILLLAVLASAGYAAPKADITLAMFQDQESKHILKMLDTNHDGKLSETEWATRKVKPGKTVDFAKGFAKIDLNHDGFIDQNELNAMFAAKFKKLDKNNDGKLSAAEQHPNKPE